MRVLHDTKEIAAEINSCVGPDVRRLLERHTPFMAESEGPEPGESLTVVLVEPGDTLEALDAALDSKFLVNHYSGKRFGEPGFLPCFETLEEHLTFYEMFFIEGGGEVGVSVVIPNAAGIDAALLAMCAEHATPSTGGSS